MLKISHNKFLNIKKYSFKVISLVLTLVLVVAVFSISAFAGEYTDVNKSKYHLANWYGLNELPYGENSGVVYLKGWNGSKWLDLTICFNKCTPLAEVVGDSGSVFDSTGITNNAIIDNFTYDHMWGLKSGDTANGNSFYFSCITDSPVYYTYGNTGEQWKTMTWSYVSEVVYVSRYSYTYDSELEHNIISVEPQKQYRTVYVYLDVSLGSLGFDVVTGTGKAWYVYSNYLMINNLSGNYEKDTYELHAISFNTPKDSNYTGNYQYPSTKQDVYYYAYACYPTSDCLRDWQLYSLESKKYDLLNEMLPSLEQQLYFISDNTSEIVDLLQTIVTGGEDYPSGGLLNDKTYSDKVDSVMGSISSDTSAGDYIKTLSSSFVVIKGIWNKIVDLFGLYSVIGLLLFLAFTAYLLGRALKGRDS